jgi:hypothetical protein
VCEADQEQSSHAPQEKACAAGRGAIHLDDEPHSEQHREDRDELAGDDGIDQRLDRAVRPGPHQVVGEIHRPRRRESAHVGREDAEERGTTQDVDDQVALADGNGREGHGIADC